MNICKDCLNRVSIPGDCRIHCKNPPEHQIEIGHGGDERYEEATKLATEKKVVVLCLWPGCGIFPLCFDSNTIFGCCNFNIPRQIK